MGSGSVRRRRDKFHAKPGSPLLAFAVILGVGVVLATGLMIIGESQSRPSPAVSTNLQNQNTAEQDVSVTEQSGSTPVHPDVPQQILIGTQPSAQSGTATIPANTLVWTDYKVTSLTNPLGAETQLQVTAQNYDSQVTLAAYINGKLVSNATYTIPPATAPPSAKNAGDLPKQVEFGFSISLPSSIPAGSVLSLSIMSDSPIIIPTNGAELSSSVSASTIPGQLPSANVFFELLPRHIRVFVI